MTLNTQYPFQSNYSILVSKKLEIYFVLNKYALIPEHFFCVLFSREAGLSCLYKLAFDNTIENHFKYSVNFIAIAVAYAEIPC